ncbi:MAG: hypothetical protein AAGE52_34100 [Myxococcota bacterium]
MQRTLSLLVFVGLACGDLGEAADVAGAYTTNLTYGSNECNLDGWNEGNELSAVPLTILQSGNAMEAEVGGGVGIYLDVVVGSRVFEGIVTGTFVDGTLRGERRFNSAGCEFTVNGDLEVRVEGDFLSGEVRLRPSTDGGLGCSPFAGCINRVTLNGAR